MFIRIHRDPEGGESNGTAIAEASADAAQSPDLNSSDVSPADKPAPQASEPVNEGKILAALLKRKPGYQATDAELDIFDKYTAGKLKPEGDDPEKEPIENAKEEKAEPEAAKPALISELMKEVGAKSEAETLEKIRELKRFTGSRDAQAYKALEQKHQTLERDSAAEMKLWADLKDSRMAPKAIQYLESQLSLARARHGMQTSPQAPQKQGSQFIDVSKFAVPEEAEHINSILTEKFGGLQSVIEKQAEVIRRLEEKDGKRETDHQMSQAQAAQLDEFVDVASMIPDLKSIAGLRAKVTEWLQNPGAQVPELEVLDQVMAEANKEKVPLRVAWKMLQADRLAAQIAGAEDRGQKKAFSHKPNATLSDMQGRAGATYTNYTDAQLKQMEAGKLEIPDAWLDKNGALDKKKMPKRAVDLLLSNEEEA